MNDNVTLILISHRSKELVLKFIENIYNKFAIIIIDNSNDKDLKNYLFTKYPNINFKIIENNGYGAAINYANNLVKTKYFLVSNPDIVGINEQNIFEFLKAAIKLNNNFSVLGPRFLNTNPKSHRQSMNNNEITEMQFLSGACMFFSKTNFDKIGGFDENFFLYFEENDFCFRSSKINKNYQVNNIKIEHNVGSSVNTINKEEEIKLKNLRSWHFIWSKFYFYKKHYGKLLSIIYFIPTLIRSLLKILLFKLTKNYRKEEKYKIRLDGLFSSIKGNKSSKRIYHFK